MDNIQKVIFDNFNLLFILALVWTIIVFSWMFWRRIKRNLFPKEAKNILYQERTASGRSHKNWLTKMGGARNCLRLVITDDELWITPLFPFSALAGVFDMDHRISREKIIAVESHQVVLKKSLLISYRDDKNKEHLIEVMPRNIEKFETTLKQHSN